MHGPRVRSFSAVMFSIELQDLRAIQETHTQGAAWPVSVFVSVFDALLNFLDSERPRIFSPPSRSLSLSLGYSSQDLLGRNGASRPLQLLCRLPLAKFLVESCVLYVCCRALPLPLLLSVSSAFDLCAFASTCLILTLTYLISRRAISMPLTFFPAPWRYLAHCCGFSLFARRHKHGSADQRLAPQSSPDCSCSPRVAPLEGFYVCFSSVLFKSTARLSRCLPVSLSPSPSPSLGGTLTLPCPALHCTFLNISVAPWPALPYCSLCCC